MAPGATMHPEASSSLAPPALINPTDHDHATILHCQVSLISRDACTINNGGPGAGLPDRTPSSTLPLIALVTRCNPLVIIYLTQTNGVCNVGGCGPISFSFWLNVGWYVSPLWGIK